MFRSVDAEEKSELSLNDKLIQAAMAYEGKLQWVASKSDYNTACKRIANDFYLLFCDIIGPIPSNVKQAVTEKYQHIKSKSSNEFNSDGEIVNRLYMNCWEFCLLALIDAGIVSREQISKIAHIVNVKNDISVQPVHALYQKSLELYKKFDKDCLPCPGDILLFFSENYLSYPVHAAICINKEGGYIELDGNDGEVACVRKNNLKIKSNSIPLIHFIPGSTIQENVENFIATYKESLNIQSNKTKEEVFESLKHTQYRNFVMSKEEQELEEQNDEKVKAIEELYQELVYTSENASKFIDGNDFIPSEIKEKIAILISILERDMFFFTQIMSKPNEFNPDNFMKYYSTLSTLRWNLIQSLEKKEEIFSSIDYFLQEEAKCYDDYVNIAAWKTMKAKDGYQFKEQLQLMIFSPKNNLVVLPPIQVKTATYT